MIYRTFLPPSHLAPYIRFFWILESNEPYIHRSMADGCMELVFHYHGRFVDVTTSTPTQEGLSSIQGPSHQVSRFQTHAAFGIFGMYAYPHALADVFGIATDELSGKRTDLEGLLGREGRLLEQRIIHALHHQERIDGIIQFLERQLQQRPKRTVDKATSWAIQRIIGTHGNVPISQLADQCHLSRRQFERKFKAAAGFSPKLYSRIIRFQAAKQAGVALTTSMAEIALDHGYYDQAHFINDFKQFSGYTPAEWFKGQAEGKEYLLA